jgi:hypothetical protein
LQKKINNAEQGNAHQDITKHPGSSEVTSNRQHFLHSCKGPPNWPGKSIKTKSTGRSVRINKKKKISVSPSQKNRNGLISAAKTAAYLLIGV